MKPSVSVPHFAGGRLAPYQAIAIRCAGPQHRVRIACLLPYPIQALVKYSDLSMSSSKHTKRTTLGLGPDHDVNEAGRLPRRVLITNANATHGIDAELIRQIFHQARSVPDVDGVYAIEMMTPEDARFLESPPHMDAEAAIKTNRWCVAADTLIITGPAEPGSCNLQRGYLEWLRQQCARSRRIVGVAGGVSYLAAIGLLGGRSAVAHWSIHKCLQVKYPSVSFRSDILYSQDGKIFTCAGALASVDLALRLVEDDLGSKVSAYLAGQILVPFRRTATCSQISATLKAQSNLSNPIADLLAWLPDQLTSDLSIPKLARRVAMSPRNFARRFREQVKVSPAQFIEDLRFEVAKRELVREGQSVVGAAECSGLKNAESLRRLFQRRLGINPSLFRGQVASRSACTSPPLPRTASQGGSLCAKVPPTELRRHI